jgi:hypothetical protein
LIYLGRYTLGFLSPIAVVRVLASIPSPTEKEAAGRFEVFLLPDYETVLTVVKVSTLLYLYFSAELGGFAI